MISPSAAEGCSEFSEMGKNQTQSHILNLSAHLYLGESSPIDKQFNGCMDMAGDDRTSDKSRTEMRQKPTEHMRQGQFVTKTR